MHLVPVVLVQLLLLLVHDVFESLKRMMVVVMMWLQVLVVVMLLMVLCMMAVLLLELVGVEMIVGFRVHGGGSVGDDVGGGWVEGCQ